MDNLDKLRREYRKSELSEKNIAADPLQQFDVWFQAALASEIQIANAMTVCTVAADGKPSARIVLLKTYDEQGFTFYTNYHSHKGHELATNPNVALVFWWEALERQIRIEGQAHKTTAEASEHYFHSRPFTSQVASIASKQSEVVADRETLEQHYNQLLKQLTDNTVTRPQHWGGYIVKPQMYEFWQGREARLSDRIRYRLVDGQWIIERLSP